MPKKLVLDREIAITLTDGKSVTVPNDEVWKLSVFGGVEVSDTPADYSASSMLNGIFSSKTKIKPYRSGSQATRIATLSGIAFKLVEV